MTIPKTMAQTTDIYLSLLWRLGRPRSRYRLIHFPVRALFLTWIGHLPSCYVLTWGQWVGEREGEHTQASSLASLLIRTLTLLEHSPPSRPHFILITSSFHIQPCSGLGLQHRNLQGTHTSGPPQGPCEERRAGPLIQRLASISRQQQQSIEQSARFFWAQHRVIHHLHTCSLVLSSDRRRF